MPLPGRAALAHVGSVVWASGCGFDVGDGDDVGGKIPPRHDGYHDDLANGGGGGVRTPVARRRRVVLVNGAGGYCGDYDGYGWIFRL